MRTPRPPENLADLRRWLEAAPEGTALDAAGLRRMLADIEAADPPEPAPEPVQSAPAPSWRVKLWTAPPETRIGRVELLEAVGKSDSWLYRHTGSAPKCGRIPHRKLDGELVFVVGELRRWIADHEDIVEAGPMDGAGELKAL